MKRIKNHPKDHCPWCYLLGISTVASSKTVKFMCAKVCGYKAYIPKKLLKQDERRKYYGAYKKKKTK